MPFEKVGDRHVENFATDEEKADQIGPKHERIALIHHNSGDEEHRADAKGEEMPRFEHLHHARIA